MSPPDQETLEGLRGLAARESLHEPARGCTGSSCLDGYAWQGRGDDRVRPSHREPFEYALNSDTGPGLE